MSLHEQTVLPAVNGWAAGRQPAWAASDIDTICANVIAISQAVTPHIVADAPLGDDATQQFLLAQAQSAIEAWLVRAAAGIRQSLQAGPPRRAKSGQIALGLRSATQTEMEALEGVGSERAKELARTLALHPEIRTLDDLDAVEGIGGGTLARLRADSYLDQPKVSLASPSLVAFAQDATIPGYLQLLDRTDLELFHGDGNTLARRPPAGGTAVARFLGLLNLVKVDAQRRRSPSAGALASQAGRHLARQALHQRYRDKLSAVDGAVVTNDNYVPTMLDMIAGAGSTLRVGMFLATASRNDAAQAGSLIIVEALEARAAAGVSVRVILDRDRPGDPYLSSQINRPVINRLRAAGIAVKQDDPASLLHSKFLVADTRSVIVGSHNLTTSSIMRTHELSVRLDSVRVAESFAARFDASWSRLP